ncbi:MAG: hypothetical protein RR995_00085 [Hungatella sp.]
MLQGLRIRRQRIRGFITLYEKTMKRLSLYHELELANRWVAVEPTEE